MNCLKLIIRIPSHIESNFLPKAEPRFKIFVSVQINLIKVILIAELFNHIIQLCSKAATSVMLVYKQSPNACCRLFRVDIPKFNEVLIILPNCYGCNDSSTVIIFNKEQAIFLAINIILVQINYILMPRWNIAMAVF